MSYLNDCVLVRVVIVFCFVLRLITGLIFLSFVVCACVCNCVAVDCVGLFQSSGGSGCFCFLRLRPHGKPSRNTSSFKWVCLCMQLALRNWRKYVGWIFRHHRSNKGMESASCIEIIQIIVDYTNTPTVFPQFHKYPLLLFFYTYTKSSNCLMNTILTLLLCITLTTL